MTQPTNEDTLRDKCADVQLKLHMDDAEWKELVGNDGGLYGFVEALLSEQLTVREGYDPNRLGSWVFIGDGARLKNLEDLYWSYVMEFASDNNGNQPFTREGSLEAELAFIKRNMEAASFNKVGLHKTLARADQRAKERLAALERKEKQDE
jgi:hypothetical protein